MGGEFYRMTLPAQPGSLLQTGDLRLVLKRLRQGPRTVSVLLVTWSPPTHLRGIPLHEFLSFLHAALRVDEAVDGEAAQPHSNHRNMYHVCKMMCNKAAEMVCSFAERFCSY